MLHKHERKIKINQLILNIDSRFIIETGKTCKSISDADIEYCNNFFVCAVLFTTEHSELKKSPCKKKS